MQKVRVFLNSSSESCAYFYKKCRKLHVCIYFYNKLENTPTRIKSAENCAIFFKSAENSTSRIKRAERICTYTTVTKKVHKAACTMYFGKKCRKHTSNKKRRTHLHGFYTKSVKSCVYFCKKCRIYTYSNKKCRKCSCIERVHMS